MHGAFRTSVVAKSAMLIGDRPKTTDLPVIRLTPRTVGTVNPRVEVAAPRHRLIARWSWFAAMALKEEMPSGVKTTIAMRIPPSAVGAPSCAIP
jgi:hypothetical protein